MHTDIPDTQALALRPAASPGLTIFERALDPLAAIERVGDWFVRSGLFKCEKVEQAYVLAMYCAHERKNPIEIVRRFHIYGGRLSMRADAMLADYRALGGKCKWLSKINDAQEAKAQFTYKENDIVETYTMDDARREKLVGKDNWTNSAPDMLRAALVRKVIRMIAPEVIAGFETEEAMLQPSPAPEPKLFADARPETQTTEPAEVSAPTSNVPEDKQSAAPSEPTPENVTPTPKVTGVVDFAQMSDVQLLKRVQDVVGTAENIVNRYLIEKRALKSGQHFGQLSRKSLIRIIEKPTEFMERVRAHCEQPVQ